MRTKIALAVLSAVLALTVLVQRWEICAAKKDRVERVAEVLKHYAYATVETAAPEYLDEPQGTEKEGAIKRLEMLADHAEFSPSPKWIEEVARDASSEIEALGGK